MKPASLRDIARLTRIGIDPGKDAPISGFSVDSRLVVPGDLFFALPGARTDGHFFLAEAAAKGARAAVVLENYQGPSHGLPLLRCRDTLAGLQELAKARLNPGRSKIVAITGSLGKTTTKEFLTTILKKRYFVACSPGTSNSKIGLPLTILNEINNDEDFLVFEMGMTHAGDISKLLEIASPHVAVITSIALVHACNFNSLGEIAKAKAELFAHPGLALGIYPSDFDHHAILSTTGSCPKVSFSVQTRMADYFLEKGKDEMSIRCPDGELAHVPLLKLPGEHNCHNFLAAAVAARYLGMEWKEIADAMPSLALFERRLQIVEKNGVVFVNDSYNAAELSLKSALSAMPEPAQGRKKIAVIGEITELGKFSHQCHHEVGEHALRCVDSVLCLGKGCEPIVECWQKARRPVFWSMGRADVVAALRSQLQSGDVVLLKGSRPNCLWKVLEEL